MCMKLEELGFTKLFRRARNGLLGNGLSSHSPRWTWTGQRPSGFASVSKPTVLATGVLQDVIWMDGLDIIEARKILHVEGDNFRNAVGLHHGDQPRVMNLGTADALAH